MYDNANAGTGQSTVAAVGMPVAPLPQVENQTQRLIGLINDATKMQQEIEERLRGVCEPDSPNPPASTSPVPVLVPLAEKLAEVADRLQVLCRSQRGLLNRIQL